ncbi:hypothetical protein CBOM_06464 [Ceraceosorus bombacis]|uniref:Uncharacterized protein n=1 Tax=Ceraceosorus bombacis TaxID=401625 RepID=A0A0P1BK52_9BASI|nr:hypothetical protein CBOM_06464 [Ceraceosorus bombacis]
MSSNFDQRQQQGQGDQKEAEALPSLAQASWHQPSSSTAPLNDMPSTPSRRRHTDAQGLVPATPTRVERATTLPLGASTNQLDQLPPIDMRRASQPANLPRPWNPSYSSRWSQQPPATAHPSIPTSQPGLTGRVNATATFARGVQRSGPPAQLDDLRIAEPTSARVTQSQQLASMNSTIAPTVAPSTLLWPPEAKSSTDAPKKTIGSAPKGTSLTQLAIAAAQAAPLPHPQCDTSNTLPSAHGVTLPVGPLSNPPKSASGRTRRLASLAIATSSPSAGGPAAPASKSKGKGKGKAKRRRAERSESSQSSEIGDDAPPSSSHASALRWMPVHVAGESPQALTGGSAGGLHKASTAPQVETERVLPSTHSAIMELCEDLRQSRLRYAGRRTEFWNDYFVWSGSLSVQSGLFRDANVLCEEMRILHGKVYQQLERFEGFRNNHFRLIQGLSSDCIKLWEEQDAFYSRLSALLPIDQVAGNVSMTASDEPSAQALTGTSEGQNI